MDAMDVMNNEWQAWQQVVEQFKQLDMDINATRCTPLVRAIELWGEELVRLRVGQTPEIRRKALREKQELFQTTDESQT